VPLRLLVAAIAGIALGVSFEPLALWWLIPPAVAALVLSVRQQRAARGAAIGLVFGLAFWLTLIWWMRAVGWDALFALSGFMTLYGAVLGVGLALVGRLHWWPLWTAVMWLAVEVVRGGWPFGGFPWGRLAFATVDTPFAHGLGWIGSNGVSLLLALTGTSLAWALPRLREQPARAVGAFVAAVAVALLPGVHPWQPAADARTITVAAIQGNVPGSGDDILHHHREVTANHVAATQQLAAQVAAGAVKQPAFVLWPENTTAIDPFRDQEIHEDILTASAAIKVPILVGAIVDAPAPDAILNQGIVWDPETGAGDRYTKRHPVPFGEYIPYRKHLDLTHNFGKLSMIPFDMMSGTRSEPLTIDGARIADAICFDVAYDDGIAAQIRAGAQLVVVQTSNAMFIHTHQIEQQWAISRLRAIESGKYVVVAATNGISGVIAPDGSVVDQAAPRTQSIMVDDIKLYDGTTPGVLLGPWLGRLSVLVSLGALVIALVPYRRRSNLARELDIEPERPSETVPRAGTVPADQTEDTEVPT